jgi:hypothetical protein
MDQMGWHAVVLGAGLALAAINGTTRVHKTVPVASVAGYASNGLPGATKPWVPLRPCWGVRQQLLKHLHNTFAGMAVPFLGNRAFFPLPGKQFVQGGG